MASPQFKTMVFQSQELFDKWLAENTSQVINLTDFGQDVSTMWIHQSGEILHTDFHSQFFSGKFVNLLTLSPGAPMEIWDENDHKFKTYHRLVPEQ